VDARGDRQINWRIVPTLTHDDARGRMEYLGPENETVIRQLILDGKLREAVDEYCRLTWRLPSRRTEAAKEVLRRAVALLDEPDQSLDSLS
jgi:hypothetical protein